MIVVPQLRGDEHVLPLNRTRPEHLLQCVADRSFIAVSFRAIEVAKPDFQCSLGCLFGRMGVWNQRAEPDERNCTGAVGEGNLHTAKSVGRCHAHIPPLYRELVILSRAVA
jgi:hypothetical protein